MERFEAAEGRSFGSTCGGWGDGKGERDGRMSNKFGQGCGFGRGRASRRGGVDGWEGETECFEA